MTGPFLGDFPLRSLWKSSTTGLRNLSRRSLGSWRVRYFGMYFGGARKGCLSVSMLQWRRVHFYEARIYSFISYCICAQNTVISWQCDKATYLSVQVVQKKCHITDPLTHLPLLFCCVAGLYGFVPRVRLNRLNWPKVVKMGSTPKKGASWKWSPGSCRHRHPGIPSLSFPLPLSDWERFLQLLDQCLATDMPTAMSLYLRFLPQNVLCSIASIVVFPFHVGSYSGYYYIIGYWSWLYKFMPTILQQKRCLFAQNAI